MQNKNLNKIHINENNGIKVMLFLIRNSIIINAYINYINVTMATFDHVVDVSQKIGHVQLIKSFHAWHLYRIRFE